MASPQSAIQGVPQGVEEVPVDPNATIQGVPEGVEEGTSPTDTKAPVIKADNFMTRAKALPGQLLETSKERLTDPTTPENKIVAPTLRAVGLPASSEEAQAKLEDHKAHGLRDAVLNYPPVAVGRMVYDMAGNLIRGQQEGSKEAHEAVQNVKEGGPILPNLGKAAYGYLHQTLSGIPFIGGNIERGGEAVHEGDIPKAIGETGAAIAQVAAPEAIHAAGELPRTGVPTYDRLANKYLKPIIGEPRTPTREVPPPPDATAGNVEYAGEERATPPDQEITPEVAAQSAASQGIKPVTRHAPVKAANSPMNKYDVVNNATEAPKAPSANETLNLPENTVRPGKQEALPPAPEQKLLPEKTAAVPLPASSIEGVPADVEGVPVAHSEPEKAIAKTEEPGKIIDQAKTAEPAEKLEDKTKGRAEEVAEKYPVKPAGLVRDPFAAPEVAKKAEPKPETVGTAEDAKKDTDLFAKAKAELGENASISDVAKRAQEMKDQSGKPLDVAKAADDFNKEHGLPKLKPEKALASENRNEIADEFEKMKHDPNNPEVKKSYDALKKDIKEQWDYATKKLGINIEATDKDPYGFTGDKPAEQALMDDVKDNKHIGVWRGGNPLQEGHPLAEVDPETGENYNTMLRAIHDIFGHVAQGHDFSEPGEESAWKAHRQMMSPEARPAMTTETRGQTSWFFNNKKAPGTFAEQKSGLLPGWVSDPEGKPSEGTPVDHTTIANAHNENGGSTFNPTKGNLNGADMYAVSVKPELGKIINGEKVTPENIKEYMDSPKVAAALKADPDLSVGTWANEGKTYLDLSKTLADKDEAIKVAKENNQKAIHYLKDHTDIPTGGTGEVVDKLTDTDQRGLEHRLGAEAAADETPEGREKQQRLLKGTMQQYADFANEQGPEKPGGGEWQPSDFSKKGTGKKEVPANKKLVIDHAMKNVPHDDFMDATSEWGPPNLEEKFKGKGPAPEATPATSKMSDEELLKHGFTQADIDAAKHVPPVGGGAAAQTALAKEKGIPESVSKNMTPEEIKSATKTDKTTEKFVDNLAKIPTVQEYIDIAQQGEGARRWYQRSAQAFDVMKEADPKYFGEEGDKDKFIGMLAGSSPRQSVAMNMREALAGWKSWVDEGRPQLSVDKWKAFEKAGRPKGAEWKNENWFVDNFSLPGTKAHNVIKALNNEPLWPDLSKNANFKVPSFDNNLKGWLNHSTNDGWMALFAGVDPTTLAKAENYHPLSIATRAAAEALGWTTAEAQAAIWSFTQSLTEKGETDPNIIRAYSEDFADLLAHDPETRTLMNQLGVSDANLDKHLAERVEQKPEISGRSTPTTAHSVRQLSSRIEEARGKGAIPAPKSDQGQLFREEHPVRAQAEAKDTSFNPNELEEEEKKPEVKVTELSNRPEKKILSIKVDGERAGQMSLTPTPDLGEGTMEISTSQLKEKFQGKGHGSEAYRQAIDYAKKEGVKTLYSDDQVSTKADRVWKSLVDKGTAEWDADKSRYRIDLEPKHRMKQSTGNPLDKYRQ